MPIHGVGQISLPVQNLERAIVFYRDHLELPFLFSAPPGLAFFQCGEVRLMLSTPEQNQSSPASIVYFKVDCCDAELDRLRPHVNVRTEPHLVAKMPDHELWMAFFEDSEKNLLGLMEERR